MRADAAAGLQTEEAGLCCVELNGLEQWREEKGVGRRLPGEGEADRATTAGPRNGEGKWATRENDEGLRQKQREGESGIGPAGSLGCSPRKRGKEENSFSFISNPISNMNQTKFE